VDDEEQPEGLPAPSLDRAEIVVMASSPTLTAMPAPVKSAALPPASGDPEQVPFFQTSTCVAPPAAVPCTFGLLSFAGEAGSVAVIDGALGPVESST
jgi:hypothetical protein